MEVESENNAYSIAMFAARFNLKTKNLRWIFAPKASLFYYQVFRIRAVLLFEFLLPTTLKHFNLSLVRLQLKMRSFVQHAFPSPTLLSLMTACSMFSRCVALGQLLFLLSTPAALAQTDETAAPPPANPEDVSSPDAIIAALYDVISGPAEQPRDWDRFRSLLTPTCQLIPIQRNQQGTHRHIALTAERYITNAGAYFDQNSFYEVEIARKTDRYGNLIHVFSTYESYHNKDDETPFMRGINSIQLIYEQDRWWIANIAWQPEWEDLAIPDTYLPEGE